MEQQDYLIRQINQLSRILGKVLTDLIGLKNKGLLSKGIEMTNQTLKSELNLDIKELIDVKTDVFINVLILEKGFVNDSLDKFAEILWLIANQSTDVDKRKMYNKCLLIYQFLEKTDMTYSLDRQLKIKQLQSLV